MKLVKNKLSEEYKKLFEDLFEDINIQELQNRFFESYINKKEEVLKQAVIEFATPKIKGEITKGKLKWRGIRLCEQPSTGKFWIEQRGVQITPFYEITIPKYL